MRDDDVMGAQGILCIHVFFDTVPGMWFGQPGRTENRTSGLPRVRISNGMDRRNDMGPQGIQKTAQYRAIFLLTRDAGEHILPM